LLANTHPQIYEDSSETESDNVCPIPPWPPGLACLENRKANLIYGFGTIWI